MAFRAESVQARLRRLEEVVSELRELGKLDREALRASLRDMWAVERGLQLGAEILFDIGNHILTAQYGVSPEDYEDILEQLASQGILDTQLRQRLKGLAGFRNILVHDYLHLDQDRVLEGLARAPKDFSDFAHAIRQWLEG
ncbi:MAG TPA: DUF86 domain-containing protein [Thermoanaerobaculia bacterium]